MTVKVLERCDSPVSVTEISFISKEVSSPLCNAEIALGSLHWSVLIGIAKDKMMWNVKTLVFKNRWWRVWFKIPFLCACSALSFQSLGCASARGRGEDGERDPPPITPAAPNLSWQTFRGEHLQSTSRCLEMLPLCLSLGAINTQPHFHS